MKQRVVLASGGIDSFLAHRLYEQKGDQLLALFVDYGQPYAGKERAALEVLWGQESIGFVEAKVDAGQPLATDGTYYPARNILFASIAVHYGDFIVMGGMRDDCNCEDKTEDAFREMSNLLSVQSRKRVIVHSPFWGITKAEAISDYLASGGDPDILLKTVSCYSDGTEPCMDCRACFRWSCALRFCGVDAPFPSWRITEDYLRRLHEYARFDWAPTRVESVLQLAFTHPESRLGGK